MVPAVRTTVIASEATAIHLSTCRAWIASLRSAMTRRYVTLSRAAAYAVGNYPAATFGAGETLTASLP